MSEKIELHEIDFDAMDAEEELGHGSDRYREGGVFVAPTSDDDWGSVLRENELVSPGDIERLLEFGHVVELDPEFVQLAIPGM